MKILLIIGLWYLGIGCGVAAIYHAYMTLTILIAKQLVKEGELTEGEYSYVVNLKDEALTIPNMICIIFVWPKLIIETIKLFNRREGI